jgi:uncharacterized protein (DUF2267 family)
LLQLGPDTGDLRLRIGIHTGPVTAGVLRGENARYQLFGDTMNTAARMESTGVPDRIQLSMQTAELLQAEGKPHWILPRDDPVMVKGKGTLQTFWLNTEHNTNRSRTVSSAQSHVTADTAHEAEPDAGDESPFLTEAQAYRNDNKDKASRLIDWNASALEEWLLPLVIQRSGNDNQKVPPDASRQLQRFVAKIASLYRGNPFHNFEHASHVTMSVIKLLARVSAARQEKKQASFAKDVASDALTHFAAVFSALIHDVDHTGFSNAVLVAERAPVAVKYENKSVAENNSIETAWELLMHDDFTSLRTCICPNEAEQRRFHDLVVSSVLATDIVDRDLKADRNARWEAAFREGSNTTEAVELRSAIVLEHLIQGTSAAGLPEIYLDISHVVLISPFSFGREPYYATLADLSAMERAILSRVRASLSTRETRQKPGMCHMFNHQIPWEEMTSHKLAMPTG